MISCNFNIGHPSRHQLLLEIMGLRWRYMDELLQRWIFLRLPKFEHDFFNCKPIIHTTNTLQKETWHSNYLGCVMETIAISVLPECCVRGHAVGLRVSSCLWCAAIDSCRARGYAIGALEGLLSVALLSVGISSAHRANLAFFFREHRTNDLIKNSKRSGRLSATNSKSIVA